MAFHEAAGERFHPDAAEAVAGAARLLAELGHEVEEVSPQYDVPPLLEAFMTFFAAGVGHAIEEHAAATGKVPSVDLIERNNLWLWKKSKQIGCTDYLRAIAKQNTVTRQFARFFSDYDIWLTPTTADPPPALGHLHADVEEGWNCSAGYGGSTQYSGSITPPATRRSRCPCTGMQPGCRSG